MDACCGPSAPPEAAAFAAEAEACAAAACDPTLEACCQRDLEEAATVARLKAQLSLHDRSKERERLAAAVLGAPPPAGPQQHAGSEEEEEDDEFVGAPLWLACLRQQAPLRSSFGVEHTTEEPC